jgi:hypothetical protein
MNKKFFSLFCTATTLALLAGCSTPGGGFLNTNVQADAGTAPTSYEQTIRSHLRYALKDPHSVVDFSVSEPVLTSCSVGVYGPFHGWRVAASYNAKNSYGAYVGLKTSYYWFHGDALKGVGANASYCPEAPSWR